ncbi:DNA-binding transcriptional regulator, GntR family [Cryobacterium flavum]|uniref:DNA-binding transcriptional regulator, GntR family n=1 Tax=Cryobacterium flavum TaxID=1424659 RepID=A0A5E9G2M5_9MICO|nr:DNA-binding transcriptional regulator, GntR family [Cryobacterium flavum]
MGVYSAVRELIISARLAPSTVISEPELAERLGVSRTPVREAIKALMAEGLVVRLASGRSMVAPISVEDAQRTYDIRARLEGLLARDATKRIQQNELPALERLLHLMDLLKDDYVEVVRLGAEFHRGIETISDNRQCADMLRQIRGHVDRYRTLTTQQPGRVQKAVTEHHSVLAAIASGDPARAERAMLEHVETAGHVAVEGVRRALETLARQNEATSNQAG